MLYHDPFFGKLSSYTVSGFFFCSIYIHIRKNGNAPWRLCFLDITMMFAIFVEGHLKTTSTKYHSNLARSFGEEDFQRFFFWLTFGCHNNQFSRDSVCFSIFKEDLIRNLCANFDYFLIRSFRGDVNCWRRRTTHDDGQIQHYPKTSHWHYVPGELKCMFMYLLWHLLVLHKRNINTCMLRFTTVNYM